MTYSIDEVMANLNNSIGSVLLGGAVLFVGYYLYCGEAIRLGFRDKTHAVPVFANMYYFAHDILFISNFNRWFFEVDHWIFRFFWVGIVVFTILECVLHYQTLRFSQQELFPRLTRLQYYLAYIGMQLVTGILFWFIYSQISDKLFLICMTSTIIVSVAFMLPLLLARANQKGQSRLLAASLIISPVGYFFLFLPALSKYFTSSFYILMGITIVTVAVIYMFCLPFYPKYAYVRNSE